jgi:hypothetical protein
MITTVFLVFVTYSNCRQIDGYLKNRRRRKRKGRRGAKHSGIEF